MIDGNFIETYIHYVVHCSAMYNISLKDRVRCIAVHLKQCIAIQFSSGILRVVRLRAKP